MLSEKTGLGLLIATSFCLWAALGCKPGGVGDPCIPEDEYTTGFSGYDEDEVNVESRSFQCETRVCLVNHFKGRVSCPYGQTQEDIDANVPGSDARRCKIPGTDGGNGDVVMVPVDPQFQDRQANSAVYCSCRCANAKGRTDDGAKYCPCPSGFKCAQLIDALGLGSAELAGGYCIRNGTEFDPKAVSLDYCNRASESCGDQQPY